MKKIVQLYKLLSRVEPASTICVVGTRSWSKVGVHVMMCGWVVRWLIDNGILVVGILKSLAYFVFGRVLANVIKVASVPFKVFTPLRPGCMLVVPFVSSPTAMFECSVVSEYPESPPADISWISFSSSRNRLLWLKLFQSRVILRHTGQPGMWSIAWAASRTRAARLFLRAKTALSCI